MISPTISPISYFKSGSSSMPVRCSACTSPWAGRGGSCRRESSSLSPRTVYPWWPAGVCVCWEMRDGCGQRSERRLTGTRERAKRDTPILDTESGLRQADELARRDTRMLYTHPAPVGAHVSGHHALEPDAEVADPILCTCAKRGGRAGSAPKRRQTAPLRQVLCTPARPPARTHARTHAHTHAPPP